MKRIQIAQGDDFKFFISVTDPQGVQENLDLVDDIISYLYTQDNEILMFSKTIITGYQRIVKITSLQYMFQLMSEDSKFMFPGKLTWELLIKDPTERTVFHAEIGDVIATKIKREIP